jgi:hypothetical protein
MRAGSNPIGRFWASFGRCATMASVTESDAVGRLLAPSIRAVHSPKLLDGVASILL